MFDVNTSLAMLAFAAIASPLASYRYFKKRFERQEHEIQHLAGWKDAILDSADYCIISTDAHGVIATFNRKAEEMLGYSAEEVIGRTSPEQIHDLGEMRDYAEELSVAYGKKIEPGFEVFVAKARNGLIDEREWTYVHKDGSIVPVYLSVTAIHSPTKQVIGFLGISTDLTEHKSMQASLRESEDRYQVLFEDAGDAIAMLDDKARFVMCNSAALQMFGCSRTQFIGSTPMDYSPAVQPDGRRSLDKARQKIADALTSKHQFFEWSHIRTDGTPFEIEVSLNRVKIENRFFIQSIMRDITERKRMVEKLTFQAGHDSLTALPNRQSLHEEFSKFVERTEKSGGTLFLMLLDLDSFKEVNDTLGHHFGDQVLTQIGPRLLSVCRNINVYISRLGGDEFSLITDSCSNYEEITELADALIESIKEPFIINNLKLSIGGSIGISSYPEHGADSHQMLRAADVAMYFAKRNSLSHQIYAAGIDNYSTQRLTFATDLKNASKEDQLVMHYQPRIDLTTGRLCGFEALVRWNHPEKGLLYPDTFIDLLEMSEVLQPFTKQIIDKTIADKKKLDDFNVTLPVAINLSARNLIDDSSFSALEAALARNNLSAKQVEIEVTETAAMQDSQATVDLLNKFKQRGVEIMIDDFGTGYSSLSHLRQLPVGGLKIDKSFVQNMLLDTQDTAIIRSTIALAHSLELKVIAEGVENKKTIELLSEMGCDQAQGFYYAKPQPLENLMNWLEAEVKHL